MMTVLLWKTLKLTMNRSRKFQESTRPAVGDVECCRTEDVLSKPSQVTDENIISDTKKQQGKNGIV